MQNQIHGVTIGVSDTYLFAGLKTIIRVN